MRHVLALGMVLLATSPSLALGPPPGKYACIDADGAILGNLTLAGRGYSLQRAGGGVDSGRMSWGDLSLQPTSGPLARAHWEGTYAVEDRLVTFLFDTDTGSVTCGTPLG